MSTHHMGRAGVWDTALQAGLLHTQQTLSVIGPLIVTGPDRAGGAALSVGGVVWALEGADCLGTPPGIVGAV